MPFIYDPELPPPDQRLEMVIAIAEHLLRLNDRLLAENVVLRRCLERELVKGQRRHRAKHPA